MLNGHAAAEYGRAAGVFTNVVIKSGTNDLHGALYEYLRNSAVDANLFFPRGQVRRSSPTTRMYSADHRGPIILPKL